MSFSSHLISSHLISSHVFPPHLISSRLISPDVFSSLLSSVSDRLCFSQLMSSHFCSSRISSPFPRSPSLLRLLSFLSRCLSLPEPLRRAESRLLRSPLCGELRGSQLYLACLNSAAELFSALHRSLFVSAHLGSFQLLLSLNNDNDVLSVIWFQ